MTKRSFHKSVDGFTSVQAAFAFAVLGLLVSVTAAPYFEDTGVPADALYQFALENGVVDAGVDETITGSISDAGSDPNVRRYIFTQSVLQKDPKTGCITFEDGTQEGSC